MSLRLGVKSCLIVSSHTCASIRSTERVDCFIYVFRGNKSTEAALMNLGSFSRSNCNFNEGPLITSSFT